MEAVGAAAALAELSKVILETLKIVNKVKNADDEQREFRAEVAAIQPVLNTLLSLTHDMDEDVETDDQMRSKWQQTAGLISVQTSFLRASLELLVPKLTATGLRRRLNWARDEKKCKEILDRIDKVESHIQSLLASNTNETLRRTHNLVISQHEDSRRQTIFDWLPSLDFVMKHRNALSQRVIGTANWLLHTHSFSEWTEGRQNILWCPGIREFMCRILATGLTKQAGAGKTVLSAVVFEYVCQLCETHPDQIAVCIHFDYKDSERQRLDHVYGDILLQMLQPRKAIPQVVQSFFDAYSRKKISPPAQEFPPLIKHVASAYTRLHLVVDALDELDEKDRRDFIQTIQTVHPNFKLFVTSRPISHIEEMFKDCLQQRIYAKRDDLVTYILNEINRHTRLISMTDKAPEFKQQIIDTMVYKAQGMFLLVKLNMDALARQFNKRQVIQQLSSLPDRLNDTYDNAFTRIQNQGEPVNEFAIKVLTWTCFAVRPLQIDEIRHALSIEPSQTDFDPYSLIEDDRDITSYCAGLVIVQGSKQTVSLVHYTTQRYLQVRLQKVIPDPQYMIAEACLTYLSFENLNRKPATDGDRNRNYDAREMRDQYPFLSYAAQYWGTHASRTLKRYSRLQEMSFALLRQEWRMSDALFHISYHGRNV